MIVVAGEALVDLVPRESRLEPLLGGSPFNVAVGLRRLGCTTAYLGRCSADGFGHALRGRLQAEGVDLKMSEITPAPTTLAVVHLDDEGRASYGFYLDGTSAAGMTVADLPALPDGAALHVSFGAVTLATDPAGGALLTLLEREAGRRVISLDPNIRPSVIDDQASYVARLEQVLPLCTIIKASDEDLSYLYPDDDLEGVIERWANAGPQVVVGTRGKHGSTAAWSGARIDVASRGGPVQDTVGAGDAFTAGLLAWMADAGLLGLDALATLEEGQLRAAMKFATDVAAITCSRLGADPPFADEVTGLLPAPPGTADVTTHHETCGLAPLPVHEPGAVHVRDSGS